MQETISLINKKGLLVAAQFLILLAVITAAPLIGNQLITGTIVNASLLISVVFLGLGGSITLCIMPSLIALFSGTLPSVLAPMVPMIILSNIIFISLFSLLRNRNYWLGLVSSSFLKFAVLFLSSSLIVNIFLKSEAASKVAVMMGWPQLATAFLGGILAFLIIGRGK